MGAIPLLVLMAFRPWNSGYWGRVVRPFLSTADIARLLPGAGMVCLNVLILITILSLE